MRAGPRNIDLCAVRIVKDDGSDAALGEIGELVVSNLLNRATVMLNYRLDDLAEANGKFEAVKRHIGSLV